MNTPTTDNKKWWVFLGCALMILLINIDATIVNLGLATIAKDLNVNLVQIQWVINSYMLAAVILFIIGGRFSDIFGHKKVFLIGAGFFLIASLVAGFANHFWLLIFGRLGQGIGFAFALGTALIMTVNAFPIKQRGMVLGLLITMSGLGQALGPTAGGAILETLNWHWIFLVNVPFATLSFIIILVSPIKQELKNESIDYFGAIFLGIAITTTLLAFNTLNGDVPNFKLFSIGIATGLILFAGFYWKEIKSKVPLIDFKLFHNRDYRLSVSIRVCMMFGSCTYLFLLPLLLQNIFSYSPLVSGLILLIYAAMIGIFSPIAGVCCDQFGYRRPIIFAALMSFLGFLLLALLNLHSSIYFILSALFFIGVANGIMIPATVNSTLSSLPESSTGEGVGMFYTLGFMSGSLGIAISGAQIDIISSHHLMQFSTAWLNQLNPSQIKLVNHIANGTRPVSELVEKLPTADFQVVGQLAKQAFIKGFSAVMWVLSALCLIATVLAFLLKRSVNTNQ